QPQKFIPGKEVVEYTTDPFTGATIKNISQGAEELAPMSNIPIIKSEEIKRSFGSRLKNAWADYDRGLADKAAYFGYRDASEAAALATNPQLTNQFKEAKETFGLLAPIQEFSEKRAKQLQQSPIGGLLDTTAGVAGGATALATGDVTGG